MIENQQTNFRLATWRRVVIITTLALIIYYALGFGFTPRQFTFEGVSIWDILFLAVVDQFLIELLDIFLLLKLLEVYVVKSGFRPKKMNRTGELLKLVPFFGLVYFLIIPLTQNLRYLLRNGFNINWNQLFWEYLFDPSLYVIYTIFFTASGISVLIWEFFFNRYRDSNTKKTDRIVGEHQALMKPVELSELYWIEVIDRKYWAVTSDKKLRVHKTISEFESELPEGDFIRLNRSVIVNTKYINSYASWGNGSYVVEMKPPKDKEFILSRNRVKQFKEMMEG